MIRSILPLLLALLLVPGLALAGPGDAAPDMGDDDDDDDDDAPAPVGDDDDDDEPAPTKDEADDEPGPTEDEEVAPEDDDDDGRDADDLQLPELEGDRDEPEAGPEEDEEALDDRYRVVVPDSDEDSATAEPEEDADEENVELDEHQRQGLVKVIQKKFFLKYRRVEIVAPQIGYVGNDDFIKRLAVNAGVGFHINEILALEILVSYLPDLGETDYKPLTRRFRDDTEVVPDISRVLLFGVLNVALSPIYGKIELGTLRIINYDVFVAGGLGFAQTKDDMEIIQSECRDYANARERKTDPACMYVDETHFVTNIGGGLRIVFNDWIGVRLDARQFTHIERVYRKEEEQIGLEMKQNFMISIGASFFFPPKARTLPL
jgi:outer membrane beta-barrel protein